MPGEHVDLGYKDIYETLKEIRRWMANADEQDVPDYEVLYNEAIFLTEAMRKISQIITRSAQVLK